MRLKCLLAAAIAFISLMIATPDVQAFGDRDRPDGWNKTRHVNHWVYYPRYQHHYRVDPYAYRYSPRGYYPYYDAGYWAKAGFIKHRNRTHLNSWNAQPPRYRYYKSWGYPRHWHHREWHAKHHGFIHRWHW